MAVSRARQIRAAVMLPGVVAVLIPALLIGAGGEPNVGCGLDGALILLPVAAGASLMIGGFALWLRTVQLFAQVGEGTLAPWDAPRRLVVEGPYRCVRNPMITAVVAFVAGAALLCGSPAAGIWSASIFAINTAWFLVYEEPSLAARFGAEYERYREDVPRWIPRRPRG